MSPQIIRAGLSQDWMRRLGCEAIEQGFIKAYINQD
jgi:hypothetical protein